MSEVDVRVLASSQLWTSGQKYRTDFPIFRNGGPSPVRRRFAHVLALTLERASSCLVFKYSAEVSTAIPHQERPDHIGTGSHLGGITRRRERTKQASCLRTDAIVESVAFRSDAKLCC
jgi:hypothetical protein